MSVFKDMDGDDKVWCVVFACATVVVLAIIASITVCTVYGPPPRATTEPTVKARLVPAESQ
jgi:hypothetical protein